MQFDLVIPTRGDLHVISPLFNSLNNQTVLPEHIFLIFDKQMSESEWAEFGQKACGVANQQIAKRLLPVTNVTHDFEPGKGASYVRNYGIKLATSKYLYLIDDDNILDEDFFEKSIKEYEQNSHHDTLLYSPSIGWRKTDRIQSVGIKNFHFWLAWPEPMKGGWKAKIFSAVFGLFAKKREDDNFYYPKMIGGNSLFGKAAHFKQLMFDERMKFIYEDIDLTYRWFREIGPIAVSKHNVIHHMEREKTKLEQSFIANEFGVYEKAKNRSIFVANNATFMQRVWYVLIGMRLSNLWFIVFILLYGEQKRTLLRALFRGVDAGSKAFARK